MPPPGVRRSARSSLAASGRYRHHRKRPECADARARPPATYWSFRRAWLLAASPLAVRRRAETPCTRPTAKPAPPFRHAPNAASPLLWSRKSSRSQPSLTIGEFDLLGPRCLDPRSTPFLDPAADPDAPAGKRLRFETRRREATRISLQDRNGEVRAPSPSEVQVDGRPAFAYRHHLALDQSEMALFGQHLGGVVGVQRLII